MTSDTDKHERVEASEALHPTVIEWCERIAVASRRYKEPPEVIADFDRLLAMAKDGGR